MDRCKFAFGSQIFLFVDDEHSLLNLIRRVAIN